MKVFDVDYADVVECFDNMQQTLHDHLTERLQQTPIKFYVRLEIVMERETEDGPVSILTSFASDPVTLLGPHDIPELLDEARATISRRVEKFTAMGSGWVVVGVKQVKVKSGTYNPIGGSSYIPTPQKIENTRAILNIQNKDNKCFLWSILAAVHRKDDANRVSNYTIHEHELNTDGIRFPVELGQVKKFEELNPTYSINVLGLDDKLDVVPVYASRHRGREHEVDLLLLTEGDKCHYTLIRSLSRLLNHVTKRGNKSHVCHYCLHRYSTQQAYDRHIAYCGLHSEAKIVMPSKEGKPENKMYYKDITSQFRVPYVVYADFETFVTEDNKYEPSSFCCYTVAEHEVNQPVVYTGDDVMDKFFDHICAERNRICQVLKRNEPMHPLTSGQQLCHDISTECEACEREYSSDNPKVRHHNHVTGIYIGPVCQSCNLQLKPKKTESEYFIPVIFHNLRGFDSHLIIKNLTARFSADIIKVIATNTEKYISFQIGMLRFIDSYQFLPASLDTLVTNLKRDGTGKFVHTEHHFGSKLDLVTRKGVFPYEYMTGPDRLKETSLPPIQSFDSKLTESSITAEDYTHAQRVWNEFNMNTLLDYQNLYVTTDVLLLADVFEEFRRMSLSSYHLDPAHFYTTPGLTLQACLKHSKVVLELFTDIDMLLLTENGIRGGISYIAKRESVANNQYIPETYEPTDPSKYIVYLDANNLYGYAMNQPLPTGEYSWLSEQEIQQLDISAVPDDADFGYLLEVDLHYPPHLHDLHNCYPLAPEHVVLTEEYLSPAAKALISNKFVKAKKLVPNLSDKSKYVVHYRNLKFYVSQGLEVTKIHQVIKFKQSAWLASYIDLNTQFRKTAKSTFEKDFYKLLNNSLYGKLMQNLRKNIDVHIVDTVQAAERQLSKHTCAAWSEINENFTMIQQHQRKIFWSKPTIIGFTVLELSKLLMYDFHYCTIKPMYGDKVKLLFTDTDSLCYEVETEDVYKDMEKIKDQLDTSDYHPDHPLFNTVNAKVIGKMKDETAGVPPLHFIGLRSKLYSLQLTTVKELAKAKGVQKAYVKRHLRHKAYVECLHTGQSTTATFHVIQSTNHNLVTKRVTKVALSSFDDKRWLLDGTPNTLAHGHWRARQAAE